MRILRIVRWCYRRQALIATAGVIVLGLCVCPAVATASDWTQTGALPGWAEGKVKLGCLTISSCTAWLDANTSDTTDNPEGYSSGTIYTDNGGSSWSGALTPVGDLSDAYGVLPNSISCYPVQSAPGVCSALGENYYGAWTITSTDGGQSWGLPSTVASTNVHGVTSPLPLASDIDCPGAGQCVAAAFYNEIFGDPGGDWTENDPGVLSCVAGVSCPPPDDEVLSVSCVPEDGCWDGGNNEQTWEGAAVWYTPNGGLSWTPQSLPVQPASYSMFTAPDPPGGESPDPGTPGSRFDVVEVVRCAPGADASDPGDAFCVAAQGDGGYGAGGDGNGYPPEIVYSTNGGTTWSVANIPFETLIGQGFKGASCPTSQACYLYGSGGIEATANAGASWTAEVVGGQTEVDSVSCPTELDCYAASGNAVFTTTDGGGVSTTLPPEPAAPGVPTDVSASAGASSAALSWSIPGSDGSGPISSYTITPDDQTSGVPGAPLVTGTTGTSATITGLTPGDVYSFTVAATNTVGTGVASSPSNQVVPTLVAASESATGTGTDPAAAGHTAAGGTLSASGTGTGTVTVSAYASTPEAGFSAGSDYFDVTETGLTTVSFTVCGVDEGTVLEWWDTALATPAWAPVSPPPSVIGGCMTFTADSATSPSISQFYGTVFASGPAGASSSVSSLTGPAISPASGTMSASEPAGTPAPKVPSIRLLSNSARVSGVLAPVALACANAACEGTARLTETVKARSHIGKRIVVRAKTILIGSGRFDLAAGTSATVTLKLTSQGRKLLSASRHLTVEATFTTALGQNPVEKLLLTESPPKRR